MAFYDHETKRIRGKCECGLEYEVDVKAELEINAYLTIKED